jgi:hypothetical protein
MITPLRKIHIAHLWSILGLPLGCVCIVRVSGWLCRALSEPNVGMDYAPFLVLGGWAAVLYGLAVIARLGTAAEPAVPDEGRVPGSTPGTRFGQQRGLAVIRRRRLPRAA